MEEQIKAQMELTSKKMEGFEVGSVQHDMYREIMKELEMKLNGDSGIKLHIEKDATCEGCQ